MAQSTLIPAATAAQNTQQPFNTAGASFVIVGMTITLPSLVA